MTELTPNWEKDVFVKGLRIGRKLTLIHRSLYTQTQPDKIILTHIWMPMDVVRDKDEKVIDATLRPIATFTDLVDLETYLDEHREDLRKMVTNAEWDARKLGNSK